MGPSNRPHAVALSVLSALATVVAAAPLAAQSVPASQPPAAAQEEVEQIVVTGSRIRKDEYTSASPVQVITSERTTLQGLVSTSEVVQNASVAAGSGQINSTFSGFVVDGGPGVATVSLRGLGAQRSLVLLNGRRLPPAGVGGQVGPVDLNILPNSIINRIEILKDGASSIYGSDAVAGVVNVITRQKTEGGSFGVTGQLVSAGGAEEYQAQGSYGWNFDRGSLSISGEWYRQEPLRLVDRDFLSCEQDLLFSQNGTTLPGISSGYVLPNRTIAAGGRTDAIDPRTGLPKCYTGGNAQGYVLTYAPLGQFLGTRTNAPALPGLTFAGATGPTAGWRFIPFEERNFNPEQNLQETLFPELERYSVFVQGAYRPEALGGAELYTEVLANRRKSYQTLFRTFFPYVSFQSPINPFTTRDSEPHLTLPFDGEQEVDVVRGLAGIRGDIGSSSWSYDVYASVSQSRGDYSRIVIPNDRVEASTGTSQSLGTFGGICPPGSPAGCVPATSLFSLDGLQRSILTPAEQAYLLALDIGNTSFDQSIFEAQFTGDLFDLPAGKVAAAIGASYREDEIDDQPGEFSGNANAWGSLTAGRTQGEDKLWEAYAELEIPVLRGRSFIKNLTLNLSGRHSDYDSVGTADTYKAGLNWVITDAVRLRSTFGTSFRAPALYELYLEDQISFLQQNQIDPCIRYGDPDRPAPPTIAANCAADLLPPDYAGNGSSAQILRGGGLGRLKPEDSESLSIGLVLTPPDLGLSIALDYFDINVENQVGAFPLGVVGACYADARFRTVPGFCDLFDRNLDPNDADFGKIELIDASYRNIPDTRTKGYDLTVAYEKDLTIGKLEIDAQATYTTYDQTELFLGRISDGNGLVGEPKWVGSVQSRFERGDWTFTWTLNYTGKGSNLGAEDEEGLVNFFYSGPSTIIAEVDDWVTNDLSVRYRADNWTGILGINNVFGQDPPTVSNSDSTGRINRTGNTPLSSQYVDGYVGRAAFLTLEYRF